MEAPANKMQSADTTKDEVAVRDYFYPEYGIAVSAGSQQEADIALAKKLGSASIST